jgi:hypothetical protein
MEANKHNSASVPSMSRVASANQIGASSVTSSSTSSSSLANTVEGNHLLISTSNHRLDADALEPPNHQDISCLNNVTSTLLPWDRFSHWLYAICLVTFDIEIGQALEVSRAH